MRRSFRDLLIAPGQTLADDVREIRILVRGARAFVDQAALFQFGEGQPSSGQGVILIEHLVGFSIKKNAPIPWYTKFNRALGANTCGAVARNSAVPTRLLVRGVEG